MVVSRCGRHQLHQSCPCPIRAKVCHDSMPLLHGTTSSSLLRWPTPSPPPSWRTVARARDRRRHQRGRSGSKGGRGIGEGETRLQRRAGSGMGGGGGNPSWEEDAVGGKRIVVPVRPLTVRTLLSVSPFGSLLYM